MGGLLNISSRWKTNSDKLTSFAIYSIASLCVLSCEARKLEARRGEGFLCNSFSLSFFFFLSYTHIYTLSSTYTHTNTHTIYHPDENNEIFFSFFFLREAEDSLSITVLRYTSVNLFLCFMCYHLSAFSALSWYPQ